MYDRTKVIAIAKAELGYKEKASNANLDSKDANVGSANYTKYARDLDNIPGFYNGNKNGYAWCDVFTDWCFVQAYGVEGAKQLLCQPDYSLGAGTQYSAQYYKDKGQFHSTPEIGDQIFFGANGGDHTGIVYDCNESNVYTIEGNTSNGVFSHVYNLKDGWIYGYGRPNYDDDFKVEEPEESVVIEDDGEEYCTAVLPICQFGSTGHQVELVQYALCRKGYLPSNSRKKNGFFDGEFGEGTEQALIQFQTDKSISPCELGKVACETIQALFSE